MAARTADVRQLKSKLAGWDARLRFAQSLIWFPRGLVAGMAFALVLAVAARFWPILSAQRLAWVAGGLAGVGVLAAILIVWLWRRNHLQMARRFDMAFGLRERLSTALELADGRLPQESRVLARRQLEQAISNARGVDASTGLPLHIDWRWWVGALVMAGLVALAVLIPNPQDDVLAQQAEVNQAIAQSIVELEQLKTQAHNDPLLPESQKQVVVNTLDQAIQTLQQPGVTQQEALAALDAAQQKLQNQSQQFAAQQQQALQSASGLFSNTAAKDVGEALKNGDFAAAAEALKNLDLNNLSQADQQALAQALGDAAQALKDTNPDLAQKLGDAADALKNGDTAKAQQSLGQAGDQVSKQGQKGQQGQAGQGQNQVQQYSNQVGQSGQGIAKAGKSPKRPGQTNQPGQGGMSQAPNYQPGQGNGSGQGQGMGQTPGQGQGQGSSQQPGQGPSGGGSGRGEGDGGPNSPGLQNGQMQTNNGPGNGGVKDYDDIFSPQRIGGQGGDQVDIPGNPDAGVPTGNEGEFAQNPNGQSTVPYNTVYGNYAGVVNQALDSGLIPLGLKDLIKSYFTSLDPNNK